jgi:5,5'-dehydrodivanillate O-demethylase
MLTVEENEMLTRVGPGTPAGEMLRRYWWPVGFSQEVKAKDRPRRIQLLGADLVLFRTGNGDLGVLDIRCAHRGTSLEFGRVEDRGLRCCYHGWLYRHDGQCLEQPAEPEDSTFHERIRQPGYRAEELGGLIFAYLGPDPAPLLPRYDLLVRQDGSRVVGAGEEYCNWLQRAENSVDQSHLTVLHASVYPHLALKRPKLNWQKTWYGIRIETQISGNGTPKISHWLFPAHTRHTTARKGEKPDHALRFRVPTNDTKTTTFWVKFYPQDPPGLTTKGLKRRDPGVYNRIEDDWWGIPSHEQDTVAQESQGPIFDRSREHLGVSDRGLIMMREIMTDCIEGIKRGNDPVGVIRDFSKNEIITFDASMAEIDALG